jgi:cytochrome c-type biogenesis protein CcmH
MPLFWFLAGTLTTLATLIVMLPQLRKTARFAALPALPWQTSIAAILIVVATFGIHAWLGGVHSAASAASSASSTPTSSAFTDATKVFANASGESAGSSGSPAQKSSAGSMNSAIANLEARLAKGGGNDGDWELLAKSFEFLGRPADAASARARKLPPLPTDADAAAPPSTASMMTAAPMMSAAPMASSAPAASAPAAPGTAVSGEISLAPALQAKAAAGETLFIVAKSVDTPGVPVAVFRGSVGSWPLKFTLDDSQSMLPGRNLSTAGRVTIEARISQKGQPLPASGDLQGSTGVINPADHQPLKILIDRVIT